MLFLFSNSQIQWRKHEILQRVALRVRLGIGNFAGNLPSLVKEEDSLLRLQADARSLGHIARFHRTPSASYPLRQFLSIISTGIGHLATRFDHLVGRTSRLVHIRPALVSCILLKAHTEIPGLRRNSILSDTVLPSLFHSRIDEAF